MDVLAVDFDGTLAEGGTIAPAAADALAEAARAGVVPILVTGRTTADLAHIVPPEVTFAAAVAENGCVLWLPASDERRPLADPTPQGFVDELIARGVDAEAGLVYVGFSRVHAPTVQAVVDEMDMAWRITLNKGSGMLLPDGVDKATGLAAAVDALDLEDVRLTAIGDAENDVRMLDAADTAVAVANALEGVKAAADVVTDAADGEGVAEYIRRHLVARSE